MRRLAVVLLALTATCVRVRVESVPYVPVLALENPDSVTYIGATRCDLQNHPVIYVSPQLTKQQSEWVLVHERAHVRQIDRFGSCVGFVGRYSVDSTFRLAMESESFCAAYVQQIAAHVPPDPDLEGIIWRLTNRYGSAYTRDAILEAMPCG